MHIRFFLKILLAVVIFLGEITISHSDRIPSNSIVKEEYISFAMDLENKDSSSDSLRAVDVLIESFIKNNDLSGASVALTYRDKLVYSKGFGFANRETNEYVQPGHLFRIASVSKLITAVAIIHLYEEGKMNLDEKVFGPDGILNDDEFQEYSDKRYEDITVSQLLNHTGGWSRYKGDPMFNSLYIAKKIKKDSPATLNDIISYVLGEELDFDPGSVYSYSNFGYALLGKIIEYKTGLPYEDMHLGKSMYYEKYPNEVRYYEPRGSSKSLSFTGSGRMVDISYGGNNIELLGAAGGWVSSAPELAKFISAVNDYPGMNDFISSESINMMTDPAKAGEGLYGWRGSDQYGTWWRTGTLSGTTALVMRMENGLSWVVLLNESRHKSYRIHNKLSHTLFAATYQIRNWPERDLFKYRREQINEPLASIPPVNPGL
jgi:CubicO group peptidase (beta-lactamase class C family)